MDRKGRLGRRLTWRASEKATLDDVAADPTEPLPPRHGGGRVVYEDDTGRHRRLPADLSELTAEERDAALAAMSQALGGAAPDAARLAAIERLTEIRAAGRISQADFLRERRRLEDYG
ncbi:MAG: hypothetical protein ACR2NB_08250 [Solirubrobacteraceae bacterium]